MKLKRTCIMPTLKNILAIALAALLATGCSREQGDTSIVGPERPTRITGTLYLEDGKPAASALVKVFDVNHVPGPALGKRTAAQDLIYSTRTDSAGRYAIDSLERGEYNILSEKDGQVSFQDSVFLAGSPTTIDPDTLLDAGLVEGTVELQPNHSLMTVTLQALGTNVYTNADEEGRFVLGPLAKGSYRIRVVTTEDQYTSWFGEIAVRAGRKDTLADAIRPAYTGIPVVMGLEADYDTLAGTATLRWNKARFPQFQEYHVFRSLSTDLVPSALPIAKVKDTVFEDHIFDSLELFQPMDSQVPTYHYRVKVVNKSDQAGLAFGYAEVAVPSPSWVATRMDFNAFNITSGRAIGSDGISIGDSIRINAWFSNLKRRIRKVEWFRFDPGNPPLHTVEFDPPTRDGVASLLVSAAREPGDETFHVKAWDDAGSEWTARFVVDVRKDPPLANAGPDLVLKRGESFTLAPLVSDRLGKVAKVEWDIGGTGRYVEVVGGDTTLIAPDSLVEFPCALRVTDDDGNRVHDELSVRVVMKWKPVNHSFPGGAQTPYYGHQVIAFNGNLWMLGGSTNKSQENAPNYQSTDGLVWQAVPTVQGFTRRHQHGAAVFQGRIWVFGGKSISGNSTLTDAWSSADGIDWQKAITEEFPDLTGFNVVVFQGRLWAVGGYHDDGRASANWYSDDGVTWTVSNTSSPMPPTSGGGVAVMGGRIWLVGGYDIAKAKNRSDVWATENGHDWFQASPDGRFSPRNDAKLTVAGNRLFLTGGTSSPFMSHLWGNSIPVTDNWHSADGIRWVRQESLPAPIGRVKHAAVGFADKLWIFHGINNIQGSLGDAWTWD
jgi:leucine-zipper-like transcriptional regulator 1